jgi:hypothetical protein
MEVQTVDTLPPVAADHDPVRCLLAIELSKKSWIVAITTALSDKISRYTLDGCDWKGLLELMERVRTRVAREMGRSMHVADAQQWSTRHSSDEPALSLLNLVFEVACGATKAGPPSPRRRNRFITCHACAAIQHMRIFSVATTLAA